ncbi:MAG: hypothetical protein H8E47_04265 [Anaerolineales bacterium]|nr:hypothetical protein [Anaerolineales bacterium]
MTELYLILRVRYNEDTDDYDFLPTIYSASTAGEAAAICEILTKYDGEDAFTFESA